MGKGLHRGTGVVALLLLWSTGLQAQETGLADTLHAQRVEGGRVCLSDHFHYGSSSNQPTRKQAEAEAISSWASFTDFEYGRSWADFRIAASRGMNCQQTGSGWSCNLEARPCKRGGAARKR